MIKFSNKFSNKFIIFHLDFENWSVKENYFEGDLSSDDVLVKAVQELAEQKPLADASADAKSLDAVSEFVLAELTGVTASSCQ